MILYLEHHFLQTVFFEKINASQLTEQLADFVAQLQRIGVTMQAYNGALNNTTHPIAIARCQAQFMQNCGPPPNEKKEGC